MKEKLLKRKGIRRVLSFVLCLAMCVSLLPVTTFAATGTGTTEMDPICVANFAEFKEAMQRDGKLYVKLMNVSDTLPINEAYEAGIIVKGEKILRVEGDNVFDVNGGYGYDCLMDVVGGSKLTIEGDGKLAFSPSLNGSNAVVRNDGGSVAISGDVKLDSTPLHFATCGSAITQYFGELIINGGCFMAGFAFKSADRDHYSATVRIYDGTFAINGGYFYKPENLNGTSAVQDALDIEKEAVGTISGGTFDNCIVSSGATPSTTKTISNYISEGYVLIKEDIFGTAISADTSYVDEKFSVKRQLNEINIQTGNYAAGQSIDSVIVNCSTEGLTVNNFNWYTWEDGRKVQLSTGTSFDASKDYQLVFNLVPDEKYSLLGLTKDKVSVDGYTPTEVTYLLGVAVVTIDMPKLVDSLNVTTTNYALGKSTDEVTVNCMTRGLSISKVLWLCEGAEFTGTFEPGKEYYLNVYLNPKSGYVTRGIKQEKTTLDGKIPLYFSNPNSDLSKGEIFLAVKMPVLIVDIESLDITTTNYEVGKSTADTTVTCNTEGLTIASYEWRVLEGGGTSLFTGTFENGKKYYLEVYLNHNLGYDASGIAGDNVKVDGIKADNFDNPWMTPSQGDVRVYTQMPVLEEEFRNTVDSLDITITNYEMGKSTADTIVTCNTEGLTIASYQWLVAGSGGDYVEFTGPFEVGKRYNLSVFLNHDAGYDTKDITKDKVTVDGNEPGYFDNPWSGAEGEIRVYTRMPAVKEILSHTVDSLDITTTNYEMGKSTADTIVTCNTEGLTIASYQWLVAGSGGDYVEFTGPFEVGKRYNLRVFLNHDAGYDTKDITKDKVTVDGNEPDYFDNPWSGAEGEIRVFTQMPAVEEIFNHTVDSLDITTTNFVAGKSIDDVIVKCNTEGLTIVGEPQWFDWSTNRELESTDSLEVHKTYKLLVYLDHSLGYDTTGITIDKVTVDGIQPKYFDNPWSEGEGEIRVYTEIQIHEFATTWKYDDNYHWHPTTCGHDKKAKGDFSAHTFSKYVSLGNGKHTLVCEVCGATKPGYEEACSGGTAICTKKAVCEDCEEEYGVVRNHDFSDQPYLPTEDGKQHYQICKDCGAKSTPVAHSETVVKNKKDTTCTEKGYTGDKCCKDCGAVIEAGTDIAAIGHTWDTGKITKEPTKDAAGEKTYTCTKCGETKVEVIDKLPDDIKPSPDPTPSPDPDKPTPDPTPVPSPEPVKPLVPEISVKGKFDVTAAVATVSDKKPVAYAITTGNKKSGKITKSGIFTAKKAGELEITAYADKKKTDEITKVKLIIKDTKVPVKDTISYMDDTCDLKSKITNLPLGIEVKFSISEKQQKIATVDAKTGIITPVKDGKAKVIVEIGEGKNAAKFYTTITVKTPKFSSSKPVVIKAGNSKPLALKNVKSDDKITWSVSDKTKAEIIPGTKDSKIKVKGIAAGRVTLTADVNGHKIIKEIEITE